LGLVIDFFHKRSRIGPNDLFTWCQALCDISRWAPPAEYDTEAYVKRVSDLTGIDPDEPLGIPSLYPSRWMAVGLAMAIVEGGRQPDVFPMMQGWTLARVGQ